MKKLSLLLIVLCSYSLFAQFENYPITNVGIIDNAEININSSNSYYLTVPEGKVWKVISGYEIKVRKPNENGFTIANVIGGVGADSDRNYMVIPSGYEVYSSENDYSFNYIEYDLSQQLSHAEPKIDNRPTLFPNPTNSMLSLNSDKNYNIQVFDLNGRKLMEQNGNSLNMEHLSNATYVVKAMDVDTKEMLSYKVVKE